MLVALSAAILLALTGCYRPGFEAPCTVACGANDACPDDLVCNTARDLCALPGGGCGTEGVDAATIDAPEPECTFGEFFPTMPLGAGSFFTPDFTTQRAAKLDTVTGWVNVTEGNIDTPVPGDYVVVITPNESERFESVRLAPGGDAIFLRIEATPARFAVSGRNGPGVWAVPQAVTLEDEASVPFLPPPQYQIGAPTARVGPSMQRLIPVTGLDGFHEFAEVGPTLWRRLAIHTPAELGVQSVSMVSFTRDGRRAVMLASGLIDSTLSIYVAERASVTTPFSGATRILDAGVFETFPYLSPDCKHLYFTDPTGAGGPEIQHWKQP